MTAKEAKQLTLKNQITLEQALEQIKCAANVGTDQVVFFQRYFSPETPHELMSLGYSMALVTTPDGLKSYICCW